MINKIYVKLKKFIIENIWFFIALVIILVINFIKIPYEVMMPGGTIDLTDRISLEGEDVDLEGSFNMAYVSVVQGSIPYVLVGSFLPDWDVEQMETKTYSKEDVESRNMSNRLQLINSKNAAKEVAYRTAGINYELGEEYTYVYAISEEANTTLKVGDDIESINGISITNVNDITEIINGYKKNDKIKIVVNRNDERKEVEASLYEDENGDIKIGISVLTTADVYSDVKVDINTTAKESGPSGGMMMALMIYNALTEQDLTNGKKIVGTGTIERDGSVGVIGGVKYKIMGAEKNDADIFLVPKGNYEEAVEVKEKKGYDIEIVSVETLDDVISYLEGLK